MAKILTAFPQPTTKEFPQQSIPVEGTKKPGQTAHYRNPKWSDMKGEYGRLTLPDLFASGLAQSKDLPCLGYRKVTATQPKVTYEDAYTWLTYHDVDVRRKAVGSALENMFTSGKLPAGADFQGVGIWSVNRPEWQIVDLACHAYNKVAVALYDTLGPHATEYVINHSELPIIFSTQNHVQQLLDSSANCPTIKVIVSIDPLDAAEKAKFVELGKEKGIEVLELSEVEAEGTKNALEPIPATLDQLATICYTSGTSGTPKGVVITHNNLASSAVGYMHGLPQFPKNFCMFSYLPLAHSYARVFETVVLASGGCLGYFTGSPLNLLSDVQALKPHVFPAVPRVLNRIYLGAMANVRAPGIKGFLFRRAVQTKLANYNSAGSITHSIWDTIVFRKVQAVLGGRVMTISSGSAPISAETLDFLRISFGCHVIEGYGLTETCAVGMRTWTDDWSAQGRIGGPVMINEVKLVDVETLGYSSEDKPNPRGEICFRGDNVTGKYYKDEKSTTEAIDADGWLHTGDVAELDEKGRFKIIDRVKNIMKLSQGEYVALEKVENMYSSCAVVAQIYVHGESLQDHLVAVVVPDPGELTHLLSDAGKPPYDSFDAACKDPEVNKVVLEAISKHIKASGAKGFEVAKTIHLTPEQFTVDNDTLTPTFKIKRKNAYNLHKAAIDGMYAKKA